MIYYLIRHKATGEFMPQLKRRGYSHWNPTIEPTEIRLKNILVGVPRLLPSRRTAARCIIQWTVLPNGRQTSYQTYDGEWDEIIDSKQDGRKREDLEIVEVNLEEVTNVT